MPSTRRSSRRHRPYPGQCHPCRAKPDRRRDREGKHCSKSRRTVNSDGKDRSNQCDRSAERMRSAHRAALESVSMLGGSSAPRSAPGAPRRRILRVRRLALGSATGACASARVASSISRSTRTRTSAAALGQDRRAAPAGAPFCALGFRCTIWPAAVGAQERPGWA